MNCPEVGKLISLGDPCGSDVHFMEVLSQQAEALKPAAGDVTQDSTDAWVSRQNLQDLYQKLLIFDLEFALDKKVEQDLWNHAFKNQITVFQNQSKDKVNPKRSEMQATLQLFLDTASGFYLQLLQEMCNAFRIELPMRRRPNNYGIVKDIRSGYSRVKMPKKSSSLYICQYCLVHLGDIARYRQQVDQAQTYYRHAAWVVPYNGQPYNQLAILEAAKGNKLATVFYYMRSAAVKHPFPVACTNLEKFYTKITRDTKTELKGKLSMGEVITGFLQFHALVHHCTDLVKAQTLCEKLSASFPSHLMSSFSAYQLVQMVAINLFALHHARRRLDQVQWGGGEGGDTQAEELSSDEQRSYQIVLELTLHMLESMVHFSPKQESKLKEHHTLAAIKLLLDWVCTEKEVLSHPSLNKFTMMWHHVAKVMNNLQYMQLDKTQVQELKNYISLPLPEDRDLQCFLPLTRAQADYSFQHLPLEGMPEYAETRIRCRRIVERGLWIAEDCPSLNFLTVQKFSSGRLEFCTAVTSVAQLKVITADSEGCGSDKRPVRQQNVAIQAIIQNKARQSLSAGSLVSTNQLTSDQVTDRPAETSKSLGDQPSSGGGIREREAGSDAACQEEQAMEKDSPAEARHTTTILKSSTTNKTPPNSRRSSKLAVTFEPSVEDKVSRKPVASQQILNSAAGRRGGKGEVSKATKTQTERGSPPAPLPDSVRPSPGKLHPSSSDKVRPDRNYHIGVPLTSSDLQETAGHQNSGTSPSQPDTLPANPNANPFAMSAFGPISFGNSDPRLPQQQQGGAPPRPPQDGEVRQPQPGPFPGVMPGPQFPFSVWGGAAGSEFTPGVRPPPRPRLTLAQQRQMLHLQQMAAGGMMRPEVMGGEVVRQGPWNPGVSQQRNPWGPGQGQEWVEPGGVQEGRVQEGDQSEDFSPRPGGAVRGKAPQFPGQQPSPIGPAASQLPQPVFPGQMRGPAHPAVRLPVWETRQPPGGQFENLHPTLQQLFAQQPRLMNPEMAGSGQTPAQTQHQQHQQAGGGGERGRVNNAMEISKPVSPSGTSSGMGSLFSVTTETRGQTPPNSGVYSLFSSSSPWSLPLSHTENRGPSSSPFGSSTASSRTSPDRSSLVDERAASLAPGQPLGDPPLTWQTDQRMTRPQSAHGAQDINMQTLWSGPSALARLLESQRPQKRDPH